MTSFRPWLAPTLLGPLLVMWGLATLGAYAIGTAALTFGTVDDWAMLMMWATFFGSTMGIVLVGADVTLLAMKFRSLPTGGRAWMSSMAVPVITYGGWMFLPPPTSELTLVLWMFLPMAAAAVISRMFFGTRP